MNVETLTTLLGWCTVINIGLLIFAGIMWILGKDVFGKMAAKLFGITIEEVKVTFFRVLLQYRLTIIMLNLVPYIALKIME